MASDQVRTYDRRESIVFLKTKEAYGGLSNMAGGFPLRVNGTRILSSEALYQACRFPHLPEIQRLIIEQRSPMTAKMKTKPHRGDSRPDWDRVRVKIMRWCLRVKLIQNWRRFGELLLATDDKPIVEESRKDDFWGAKPINENTLTGINVLGRLLMELREQLKSDQRDTLLCVEPLEIPDFLLMGQPIDNIAALAMENKLLGTQTDTLKDQPYIPSTTQASLLDQPSLFDTTAQHPASASESMTLLQEKPVDKRERDRRSMITDIRSYRKMKDSGVPWLGEVPDHWEVLRLKHACRSIVGGSTPSSAEPEFWDGDLIWVTPTDVSKTTHLRDSQRRITQAGLNSCSSELVPAGGLVITSRAPVGNVAIAETELCTNQGCKALVIDDDVVKSVFGFHVLNCLKDELQSLATGTTFTEISTSKLGTVSIPLPSRTEQTAIVNFLDYVNRRIRCYIRAKQKLIKLLEEQKQAIIHRAVTRGLDPDVPLKPSGVEWLGDVPEHWDVRRNGRLFSQRNETGFADLPILEVSLRTGVRVRSFENTDRKQVMSDRDKYKRAVSGDIAYNMMRMWQGAVGVAPTDGLISPAYVVAKPLPGTESRYFIRLFRTAAYMTEIDKYSRGIVKDRNRLYWEDFKRMPSCYPPPHEQVMIADAIDKECNDIDTTVDRIRSEIELLREFRTRLIADVVTGKLDVREAAAQIPDVVEETEPLDEASELPESNGTEESRLVLEELTDE